MLAAGAIALMAPAPAAADPVTRWQPLIEQASRRCAIPAVWIARVMRAESGGRTQLNGRPIVSRAGAIGLMQLMPGTWADMRAALGLGTDPHAPHDNVMAGACYLRRLYDRFGHPGLFAAYNAGPARYAAHLATGRRLPAETRAYLASLAEVGDARADAPPPQVFERPGLFFVLTGQAARAEPRQGASNLFAVRRDARAGE